MSPSDYRSEEELVSDAVYGDLHAFDALVRRYRPAAILIARQILKTREQAEDAAQDSLITAYKALPQLRDPQRFGSWLAAIVRHRCIRMATAQEEQHSRLDELIAERLPALRESVPARMFDCLPDELRSIVELYYGSEWTVQEIAELLGLPATTVKWRLHTARQHLRQRLGRSKTNE